jgi:uncharacterized membrane protein
MAGTTTTGTAVIGAVLLWCGAAGPAAAELEVCNTTGSRVGVAIGYEGPQGWVTEGWWNIAAQSCETLLKEKLPSRRILVHALDYDRGGEWSGPVIMCTDDRTFAIRGPEECAARGHRASGFFEVDTGNARQWTVRLSDPDEQGKSR